MACMPHGVRLVRENSKDEFVLCIINILLLETRSYRNLTVLDVMYLHNNIWSPIPTYNIQPESSKENESKQPLIAQIAITSFTNRSYKWSFKVGSFNFYVADSASSEIHIVSYSETAHALLEKAIQGAIYIFSGTCGLCSASELYMPFPATWEILGDKKMRIVTPRGVESSNKRGMRTICDNSFHSVDVCLWGDYANEEDGCICEFNERSVSVTNVSTLAIDANLDLNKF
ncbi:hypothetical protein SELMODRAFT_409627 [Selaginella moellendorffii]|uniref:Uncharacterized protein n=1 Tax=Selaginella moellendorffii TaxID=88036 RepID=D8RDH9_SELML|nr:hypothetical protein SELMODRAFT_409627 [Selaginella moellendorffii]